MESNQSFYLQKLSNKIFKHADHGSSFVFGGGRDRRLGIQRGEAGGHLGLRGGGAGRQLGIGGDRVLGWNVHGWDRRSSSSYSVGDENR